MSRDLRKGENNHNAKADENIVKAIRTASIHVTNTELAALFGLSKAQVGQIRSKKAWKHVA